MKSGKTEKLKWLAEGLNRGKTSFNKVDRMPADYLKDLISQAKKNKMQATQPIKSAANEIPPMPQSQKTIKKTISEPTALKGPSNDEIEKKISEVRAKLKEGLAELEKEQAKPEKKEEKRFGLGFMKRKKTEETLMPKQPTLEPSEPTRPKEKQPLTETKQEASETQKPFATTSTSAESIEAKKPPAEKSEVEKEVEKAREKIEVESYGNVKIYKVPGQRLLYYFVPVPRPTISEKRIIRILKEAATRLITIAPYKIRDPQQRRAVYKQKILDILRSSSEIAIPKGKMEFYTEAVIREMVGYGLIDPLVKDDKLEEIMVIGSKKPVYVFHRDYEMMKTNIEFINENEINDLINRIGREVGRRVDMSNPLLDARLSDGSRVNATIAPASISGSTLTIRKFRKDPFSIIDMVNMGTINTEVAAFLWLAVEGLQTKPANILIAGGTGSGKTTTLNVLASFIPDTERVITIEDTAELNLPLKHWIRFEAKPPGLENKGEITLDILTKNSLRMRPDRIIVGEIRHDEAFSLFTAMNTGHDGSLGTVHANSAQEAIVRITTPPMSVPEMMLSGLDFIIVEHRLHDRKKGTIRRITEISEVTGVLEGKAQTQTIYEWNPVKDTMEKTGVPSNYLRELSKLSGMNQSALNAELKKREQFIKELSKAGIHSIEESSEKMKQFLAEGSE